MYEKNRPLFALLIALTFFSPVIHAAGNHDQTTFENVSDLLQPFTHQGQDGLAGIAWLDYDADGDLDLYLTGGNLSSNGLFENDGHGAFTEVTAQAGLTTASGHFAAVAGDIDNDGYPDLFVTGAGNIFANGTNSGTRMYHNQGDGTFTNISATSNTPGSITAGSAAMGDVNNDGFLDLFVTGPGHAPFLTPPPFTDTDRLYLNNGDLTFTDITLSAGVVGGLGSCVASFSDYNNDGWQDIFVAVCNDPALQPTPFHLYENNQDGTFTDVASATGMDIMGLWMSITMGDFDNDGDFDLFSTNLGKAIPDRPQILMRNNGNGTYTNVAPPEIAVTEFGWGSTFADWNNDGWLDLFFTGSLPLFPPPVFIGPGFGNPGRMYFNDGAGGFIENNAAHGLDLSSDYTSGVARADYDNDGAMDLAIATAAYEKLDPLTGEVIFSGEGTPVLLHNNSNNNHWLTLRLRGTQSNRMGIGAVLKLFTLDNRQLRQVQAGSSFGSSESPWPTFGMGKQNIGILKVTWPSGIVEGYIVHSNRIVDLVEGSGFWLGH